MSLSQSPPISSASSAAFLCALCDKSPQSTPPLQGLIHRLAGATENTSSCDLNHCVESHPQPESHDIRPGRDREYAPALCGHRERILAAGAKRRRP